MKKADKIDAFLGQETEFEGNLKFKDTIKLDGSFNGKISSTGTLIVGTTANINAEISVSSIIVSGTVHGTIKADKEIDIRTPGKVYGDIEAPTVTIQAGAILEGNCVMEQKEKEQKKKIKLMDAIKK